MSQYNHSYSEALSKAKELGITENDPKDDVDGYDSLYKAVILAGFGMHVWINPRDIIPVSISNIKVLKDRIIRPTFSITYMKDTKTVKCQVSPQIIEPDDILASVSGKNNIIVIRSSESGARALIGEGAGARPTASAMFDDLVKIVDRFILM